MNKYEGILSTIAAQWVFKIMENGAVIETRGDFASVFDAANAMARRLDDYTAPVIPDQKRDQA